MLKQKRSLNSDILTLALRLAIAHKLYTGLLASLVFSAMVAIFSPSAAVRQVAEKTGYGIAGGYLSTAVWEKKNGKLKAAANKHKAIADEASKKLADKELDIKQRELTLQVQQGRLSALESTYKQRCDNAAQAKLQRDIKAERARIESNARARTREAESREQNAKRSAIAAEAKFKQAAADYEKAIASARAHFQSASDQAILEKQVEVDKAHQEAAVARADADKARLDAQHIRHEFGEHQAVLEETKADFRKRVLLAVDAAGQAVAGEYEKEASKVDVKVLSLAESLRRETIERAALKAENAKLLAPKRCLINGKQGDMARSIQTFVHGLRTKDDRPVRMHFAGVEERGKIDVFSFEPIIGTPDDINPHKAEMVQFLRVVGIKSIAYNGAKGCIEFAVTTGAKQTISSEDIGRILKPSSAFKELASQWHRVRITGGSESGKSPTAELIAYAIKGSTDADLYFHNPVADSLKAHMSLPQVSSGDKECLAALLQLGQDLVDMSNGLKAKPSKFQFHVFDEIDTLIKGSNEAAQAIELIIKRGSHYGIGIALIGQSDATTIFKGFTQSDLNNVTTIALGENAKTFIEKAQVIDTGSKNQLKERADLVASYCQTKNAELKLIATGPTQDASACRYALVKQGNKPVTFYLLPEFGSLNPEAVNPVSPPASPVSDAPQAPKAAEKEKTEVENDESADTQRSPGFTRDWDEGGLGAGRDRADGAKGGEAVKVVKTGLRLLDLSREGVKCPYCAAVSSTYRRKRIRKSDSTVAMKCKTEGCSSGGEFRVQIVTNSSS